MAKTYSVSHGGFTILGKSRSALIRQIVKMLKEPWKYAGRGEAGATKKALVKCLDMARKM